MHVNKSSYSGAVKSDIATQSKSDQKVSDGLFAAGIKPPERIPHNPAVPEEKGEEPVLQELNKPIFPYPNIGEEAEKNIYTFFNKPAIFDLVNKSAYSIGNQLPELRFKVDLNKANVDTLNSLALKLSRVVTGNLYLTLLNPSKMQLNAICDSLQSNEKIKNLHLEAIKCKDECVVDLRKYKLTNIISLNLRDSYCGDREFLLNCHFPKLASLSLEECLIGTDGMGVLADCNFPELTSLDLTYNWIRADGMRLLIDCKFPKLTSLKLFGNQINVNGYDGDSNNEYKGVEALSQCNFPELALLNLGECNIKSGGLKYLKNCTFGNLATLILNNNKIDNDGMRVLAQCKFPDLALLDLSKNKIVAGDAVIETFTQCNFPKLNALLFGKYWSNSNTLESLKQIFPNLKSIP